jgi:FAD/FMN-containing dehydrogenase
MIRIPSPETLERMANVVGPKGVLSDEQDKAPYLKEWRGLWTGVTPIVLRPQSTDEVSRILAIAYETETAIVPQSGNTGLVGGQIPNNDEVLLSLDRMTRIINVDATDFTLTTEAGATLKSIQDAAEAVDRLFPLSLASEGTCRIGGNLSTNAGGLNVLAYGNTRDLCLGLEVVLADGRLLNMLKTLRKDNTGYDLKNMFIGAEGTLGIITAATLKLFPRPRRYDTILVAVPTPAAALELLSRAKDASGNRVVAFELIPEIGVQFTIKHMHTRRAVETVALWYVLFEMADVAEGAADRVLEAALESGIVLDGVTAQSETQRHALWALRENMSESQKFEGGSIKHDVSVPVSKLPQFITEASAAVETFQPGVRICCFGHMGDGNMHFNVSQPLGMDKQAYLASWHDMNRLVHDIVMKLDGSFSAEHGIGVLKRDDMQRYKSAVELDVMRSLKHMLDPKNILNPGRVLP